MAARRKSPGAPAGGSFGSPSQTSVTSLPPAQIGPMRRRSIAPAAAASLQPEFGPGTIACCRHPSLRLLRAEYPGSSQRDGATSSQVIRAGIQFMRSSLRAPHQPKRRYRSDLYPTIESMVLTTLNSTRQGSPPNAYQNTGLTKPSVRFSVRLSIAARTHAGAVHPGGIASHQFGDRRVSRRQIAPDRGALHVPAMTQQIAQRQQAVNQKDRQCRGGDIGQEGNRHRDPAHPHHAQNQEIVRCPRRSRPGRCLAADSQFG